MLKNTRFFKRTMSSSLGKSLWILISASLMFAAPTYLELVLHRRIPFPYLEIVSVVLFIFGLYIFLQVYEEK
jgi:hypothetical protein